MLEETAPRTEVDRLPQTIRWLLRRWPAFVAGALVVPDLIGGATGDPLSTSELFGQTLPMLALVYLLMARIGNRRITWPIVVLVVAGVVIVRVSGFAAPSSVLIGACLVLLVWVTLDGHLGRSRDLRVQAVGVAIFCGLAVAGLAVNPGLGIYVIAAGWFLHGMWDFVHLWRDRVVSRTFAEWCGVFDGLVAVQLVLLAASA